MAESQDLERPLEHFRNNAWYEAFLAGRDPPAAAAIRASASHFQVVGADGEADRPPPRKRARL
eukprot:3816913-Alexandrium_andersonii.AAC.1